MNHEELRAAAEAATAGPWQIGGVLREIIDGDVEPTNLAVVYSHKRATTITGECWDGDARYIALANPQTVLALLDENARLRAALDLCINNPITAHELQIARAALASVRGDA